MTRSDYDKIWLLCNLTRLRNVLWVLLDGEINPDLLNREEITDMYYKVDEWEDKINRSIHLEDK